MGINEKITYLQETKELIRDAIEEKGVEVADTDSFRSYADKIKNIPQEGGNPFYEDLYNARTSNGTNMAGLFSYTIADSLDLSMLDTSKVTNMSYMFKNSNIKDLNISNWDTSNVTNISYMFASATLKDLNISNWDTSNVTNISYMFANATLKDIKGLHTLSFPKVSSFEYLFNGATCDTLDLSSWDTSKVTNMNRIFYSSKIRRIDLSNWDTSKVTNMSYAFNFAYNSTTEELLIPDWDMTNTTSYSSFFGSSSAYIENLRYVDLSRSNELTISRITSFLPTRTATTYGDIAIPEDSSQAVIDAIIAKYWRPIGPKFELQGFQISSELDEILLNRKTKVVCHSPSKWYATIGDVEFISSDDSIATVNENGEVSAISLGSVDIYARLKDNPEVTSNTITINVSDVDSTPYVIKFKGTKAPSANNYIKVNGSSVKLSSMNYDVNTGVYTYDVGTMIESIKFNGYGSTSYTNITELLKFDFNANDITSLEGIFSDCTDIKSLDLSDWDVSKYTSIHGMFADCTSLTSLNISNWDAKNITKIGYAFNNCSSLISLDLSGWDISSLVNATWAFGDCSSLETLDVSSWTVDSVNQVCMFTGVKSTCNIYVSNERWQLPESECDFTGTFIRV